MCEDVIAKSYQKDKKDITNKIKKDVLKILKDEVVPFIKERAFDALSETSTSRVEALHSLHSQLHSKNIPTKNQIGGKMGLTVLIQNHGYEEAIQKTSKCIGS